MGKGKRQNTKKREGRKYEGQYQQVSTFARGTGMKGDIVGVAFLKEQERSPAEKQQEIMGGRGARARGGKVKCRR